MNQPIKKSESSPNLIPLLVVVLGIVGGYLYYSNVSSNSEPVYNLPQEIQQDSLSQFKNLELNFKVLENSKYRSLEIFGESPVSPGTPGKTNIFAQ